MYLSYTFIYQKHDVPLEFLYSLHFHTNNCIISWALRYLTTTSKTFEIKNKRTL